jgi:hypothetical protein
VGKNPGFIAGETPTLICAAVVTPARFSDRQGSQMGQFVSSLKIHGGLNVLIINWCGKTP